jgi:triphosphoribosyl-dephospho-CoA synthase CitG
MANFNKLSEYLSQAILLEVSAYPKPGLVNRHTNGAHSDMSILTFAMSSVVVSRAYYKLLELGKQHTSDMKSLFHEVRQVGIKEEQSLLQVTKGVNTQRGILFAGGILAAAGGYLAQKPDVVVEDIFALVANMTKGLVKNELENLDKKTKLTAGELLYKKYGITGIRGEVEQGFPSVRNIGVPALKTAFEQGIGLNDAIVHGLISLMTCVEDSNVIWRANYETLQRVQLRAKDILAKGSIFTSIGREEIQKFDHDCVEHRISPGGAADLLSITIALFLLEKAEFPTQIM